MAQSGFTPIQLYYSTTASAVPLNTNLASGELALNVTDGKLYYKDNTGTVKLIANASTASGSLPGGGIGTVVYQSSTGVTAYLTLGTSGYLMTAGSTAPQYSNPALITVGTATTATNIAGGSTGQVVFQTSANTTGFSPTPATAGLVLGWTGTTLGWVTAPAATTATSIAGGAAFQVPYQTAPSVTAFSPNFQFNGSFLLVGDTASLASTNPTIAATGNQNLYIQSYIYNANSGSSASADFVAYANNSTDASGWIDMSFSSSTYADAAYSVVGENEGSIFMSAPSGAGKSGNLVYATDSTGSANSHQWYIGGFAQAKSAWRMQLTSTGLQLKNALASGYGGTGLVSVGTAGNLLTSTGSGWASLPAPVTGPSISKTYYMAQF